MNRGLARRTVFESRADMRRFMAELAREVRAKRLEVHAFALMTTHYHLLVRSPSGELAEALRRIQNAYVRWFNRGRRRDGPLFRGRFTSRRVEDRDYWLAVVRYVDLNPVEARLACRPEDYPYGSARIYRDGSGRRWLSREHTQDEVCRIRRCDPFSYAEYAALFHTGGIEAIPDWVRRRMFARDHWGDDPESLLDAASEQVVEWMERKARLADGTSIGMPICDPHVVQRAVAEVRLRSGIWRLRGRGPPADGWRLVEAVLLGSLCGASLDEIGRRCSMSKSAAAAALRGHVRRLESDAEYRERLDEVRCQVTSCGVSAPARRPAAGEQETQREIT